MQIEFENLSNDNFISSYGSNYIVIKNTKYFKNIILIDTSIEENIETKLLFSESLIRKKIKEISINNCDFILFGTGKKMRHLPSKTIELLIKRKISYEIMTSIAAFKTYNILLSQGRKTLAFLNLET